jgi:hypothetical protein
MQERDAGPDIRIHRSLAECSVYGTTGLGHIYQVHGSVLYRGVPACFLSIDIHTVVQKNRAVSDGHSAGDG